MNHQNQQQQTLRSAIPQNHRNQQSQTVQIPRRVAFEWPIGYGNHMMRKFNEQQKQKLWQMVSQQDKDLFNDYHPYGVVFFKNDITIRQSIQLFPYSVIVMLRWQSWIVSITNEQDRIDWPRRFAMMQECQIDFLEFRISPQFCDSSLWKSIEPIGFPDLTNLQLYKCAVINIEPLAHLNAPKLRKINLIYNHVSQFKVFNKLASSQLKQLLVINRSETEAFSSLLQTACLSFQNFSRWDFELEDLRLEKHYYNSVITNDLSFLAKSKQMKSTTSQKVCISRHSRILQRKLIQRYKKDTKIKFQIITELPEDRFPQNVELYQVRE